MVKIRYPFILLSCLLLFIINPAFSQNDTIRSRNEPAETLIENIPLFENDELLNISLRFDITQYKRKRSDKDYLDAILTYYKSNRDSVNTNVKVRSRGIFRHDYCDFPPIMLNFKTKDSENGEFFKIHKLKMVTQCKPAQQDYLLKEYLVYKLYNVLTENSFRVRLLKVNYINTSKLNKPESQFAFVIEPVDLMAHRVNSVEVKTKNLTQKKIKPEMMDRLAIFNYMIGNTDWSVPVMHNVLVFSQGGSDRPDLGMIVPYDFDYSGLVNTNYAVPFEGLKIKSVSERQYLGICRDEKVFIDELKEFKASKDKFYKVINDFPYLKDKAKKDMISYLDEFFHALDGRNTLVKKILNDCLVF